MSKNEKLILLLIIAVGFFLRLNNLSGRSLWTDEFFTLFQSTGHGIDTNNLIDDIAKQKRPDALEAGQVKKLLKNDPGKNLMDVSRGLQQTDTHPPLYFWVIYLWMKCFGDSVFSIRFFSLLMGISAIFFAYLLCNYLFGKAAGIFGALFVSISAFSVRFSQEARSYAMIMALALLSWFFLVRFEKEGKRKDLVLFTISSVLGLYTHYFYAFILIAQFIYFSIIYRNNTGIIRKFYFSFLISLLLFLPWVLALILKGYNFSDTGWVFGYPGLYDKIYPFFAGFNLCLFLPGRYSPVFLITGAGIFIFLLIWAKKISRKFPHQAFFCLLMFFVPLSAMFFIDIVEHGALLKQERFWIIPFIGFIPIAGYFLSYIFSKNKLYVFTAIFLMLFVSIGVSRAQFGPAPKEASDWISEESKDYSSIVLVYNTRSVLLPQAYYSDNDTRIIPVSDERQMSEVIENSLSSVGKVFLVRHFHLWDSATSDQPFMDVRDFGRGFRFKTSIDKNNIRVFEYIK